MHRNIVLLCDGTWCGTTTNTDSNISILHERFKEYKARNISKMEIKYMDGIGVSTNFINYIVDGAIAVDTKKQCIEAYEFIANHFDESSKVLMFGLSRGAYIIRCVAGMINNCGIIRNEWLNDLDTKDILLNEIYRIYRSRDDDDKPKGGNAIKFKSKFSHITSKPPIKFMGLIDTVGSLGIPKINYGSSLRYDEFYDNNVSTEVQHVYQALSIHDRFFGFEPCFVSNVKRDNIYPNTNFTRRQVWFPGAHYDLGRQDYKFAMNTSIGIVDNAILLSTNISSYEPFKNIISRLSILPNFININKECITALLKLTTSANRTYANYVLEWMINNISDTRINSTNLINNNNNNIILLNPGGVGEDGGKDYDIYSEIENIIKNTTGEDNGHNPINTLLTRDRYICSSFDEDSFYHGWINEGRFNKIYGSNAYIAYTNVRTLINQRETEE